MAKATLIERLHYRSLKAPAPSGEGRVSLGSAPAGKCQLAIRASAKRPVAKATLAERLHSGA